MRTTTKSLKVICCLALMLMVMVGGVERTWAAWAEDIPIASSAGDDIRPALASSPDGTIYAAIQNITSGWINLYRSTNGGKSWDAWFSIKSGDTSHNPSLAYLETSGGDKWVYTAYEATNSDSSRSVMFFRVAADNTGNWNFTTIASDLSMPSDKHIAPEIASDYPIYSSSIYLYVTYAVNAIDNYAVMFSRSTDYGDNWSMPVNVTGGTENSAWQTQPDISYGTAGLFITFEKLGWTGSTWANQIWMTKSNNYGSFWETPVQLTTHSDAEYHPRVSAAVGNSSVLIAYTRDWNNSGDLDINYAYSTNGGSNWTIAFLSALSGVNEKAVELDRSYSEGNFHAAFWQYYDIMYRTTPTTSPSSWSTATLINEANWASSVHPKPAVCVNPARSAAQEAGIAWTDYRGTSYDVYFDAAASFTAFLPAVYLLLLE